MIARGLAGPSKNLRPPGEFEQIGDALHRRRRRRFANQPDDRVRMADTGQPPGADQALAHQPLEHRADMGDEGRISDHPLGGAGPLHNMVRIGYDIRMQEEQIEPLEAQPAQAARDRAAQQRLDFATPRLAEIAFAGEPHPLGQSAAKRCTDHLLRLAVAIARGEIDEVDPGLDRHLDGGDALLERRLAPHHAEPAAAQGQGRNRPQPAELMLLHELRAPVDG